MFTLLRRLQWWPVGVVNRVSKRAKAISYIITFALQLAVCSAHYEYNVAAIS
jgi:hypothetical protein